MPVWFAPLGKILSAWVAKLLTHLAAFKAGWQAAEADQLKENAKVTDAQMDAITKGPRTTDDVADRLQRHDF